jgi:hypothetical protein
LSNSVLIFPVSIIFSVSGTDQKAMTHLGSLKNRWQIYELMGGKYWSLFNIPDRQFR